MSGTHCPHLVQEYFERVSDILTTYRLQILKQVEYDRISENLVLRGAIRPEEHERIILCGDKEGEVSQMLVVLQNRMWGLENLLAVFMEENISPYLTQEIFRAYNEHLVAALKQQRDQRTCQCVRMSNSILYKGWVTALKSLDSWILKTGTLLGFMNQTLYPNDNLLVLLSEKLAEITGGDSQSTQYNADLVPYGFSPNSSGEVQVAELEEDDINDLISLSETLCVAYPSSSNEEDKPSTTKEFEENEHSSKVPNQQIKKMKTPTQKKVVRKTSVSDVSSKKLAPARRSSADSVKGSLFPIDRQSREQDLISRLSTPKGTKSSTVNRHLSVPENNKRSHHLRSNSRPISSSSQLNRSVSVPTTNSVSAKATMTTSTSSLSSVGTSSSGGESKKTSPKNASGTFTGKTKGFIRSKNTIPTSPKAKGKVSPSARPTGVTKPTIKSGRGELKRDTKDMEKDCNELKNNNSNAQKQEMLRTRKVPLQMVSSNTEPKMPSEMESHKIFEDEEKRYDDADNEDFPELPPEMSSLFICNNLGSAEEQQKNLGYYQLNFDEFIDD